MHDQLTIAERQGRVRGFLDRLGAKPPQVLLLEGGSATEREAMALHWAMRLNCSKLLAGQAVAPGLLEPSSSPRDPLAGSLAGHPCRACPDCVQVMERVHRDLVFLDSRVESIKVDTVRELRPLFSEPPRGAGRRVVVLMEAQALEPSAANCLLKALEEPQPGTVFVLTAPQRERLLPTLVSRSFVLTLAWPRSGLGELTDLGGQCGQATFPGMPENGQSEPQSADAEDPAEWARAMAGFWRTGRGWFARTSDKGRLDAALADRVLVECQRGLAATLAGRNALAPDLAHCGPETLRKLDTALDMALECLEYKVNPALTLDWLAVTGHGLLQA